MGETARRIRIALMLTAVEFGGAQRVCLTLLKHIDRERFDVFPILLTRPWEPETFFARAVRDEGFQFAEIPVAVNDTWDPGRVIRSFRMARGILRGGDFDLVHTHGYFADIVGISSARLMGIPTVATCHGFIANSWKDRLYNALDRAILRHASRAIVVSEDIRDDLIRGGVRSDLITIIENAVGPDVQSLAGRQKPHINRVGNHWDKDANPEVVLGYVGRLSPEKGLRFLLEACAQLTREGTRVAVCIVGTGPDRERLEAYCVNLRIADRTHFTGFQEDVRDWFSEMDVFVLPSLTEGMPMALLEAMMAGVPVIASAVGGVPKVIQDEVTGVLVRPGDPKAIACAVRRLIADREMSARLTENARKAVGRKYGVMQWARAIENIYDTLCRVPAPV